MKVTITKDFRFEAAHALPRLPRDHKCHRMHGHSYEVTLHLRGPVDKRGFVVDYDEIETAWAPVHEALDHRTLNYVPGLEVPSTEVLATWILVHLLFPQKCHGTAIDLAKRKAVANVLRAVTVHEAVDTDARAALEDLRDHPELMRDSHARTSELLCGPSPRDLIEPEAEAE
jgi:6-pyruvoyltetrahydropterin/6-carboxytetrahydropterin synthase